MLSKDEDGKILLENFKDEKFEYYGVHWIIQFLRVGIHEKPIYRGELPRKVGLDRLQIYVGACQKRVG